MENYRDPFAVAVVRSGVIVGHVPRKILSICSMFLRRGGTISCRVTGGRRYSEDLPQGGLEVPCTLTLRGSHGDVDKVKVLLKRALSSNNCAEENEPPKKPKRSLPDMIYPSTMQITMAMPPLNRMQELYLWFVDQPRKTRKLDPSKIFCYTVA